MTARFLAIVNPAAGGGKCGRLASAAIERVRSIGIELDVVNTSRAGQATELARDAYQRGVRRFLAVGGDGTAYEIVNGLFPAALSGGRPALGFLPLGTGNSFLKDFTTRGVEHTIEALKNGSCRACDLIRLRHSGGELYFLNLVSLGFPADVGELVNRRFKRWGELGYIAGVFIRLVGLRHMAFPHRLNNSGEWDRRPCLLLAFSNSKFTGGKMMIAPKAEATDGQIEYVRWGPISRLGLVRMLPRLFTGTHIDDSRASRAPAQRVELEPGGPTNVMIDGEILRLECLSIEILPAALDAIV
ncbi:MAG: diacylglycerol kinase family protein [Candidatus Acidiferrales bacterium]